MPVFDRNILALYKTCFAQTFPESSKERNGKFRRRAMKPADDRRARLLRARQARQHKWSAAQYFDDVASFHAPLRTSTLSFDYFIGARDERQGNRHAERFGGFDIDRHFERRRLDDRKLSRLFAF